MHKFIILTEKAVKTETHAKILAGRYRWNAGINWTKIEVLKNVKKIKKINIVKDIVNIQFWTLPNLNIINRHFLISFFKIYEWDKRIVETVKIDFEALTALWRYIFCLTQSPY